jgi:hypothetical protein
VCQYQRYCVTHGGTYRCVPVPAGLCGTLRYVSLCTSTSGIVWHTAVRISVYQYQRYCVAHGGTYRCVPVPAVLCDTRRYNQQYCVARWAKDQRVQRFLGHWVASDKNRVGFSVVGIVTRLGTKRSGNRIRRGLKIYLFPSMFSLILVSTQPPIPRVTRAHSQRLKRPVGEASHLRPSRAEVKNKRSYTSTLPICLSGVYKDRLILLDKQEFKCL